VDKSITRAYRKTVRSLRRRELPCLIAQILNGLGVQELAGSLPELTPQRPGRTFRCAVAAWRGIGRKARDGGEDLLHRSYYFAHGDLVRRLGQQVSSPGASDGVDETSVSQSGEELFHIVG
jgi:hypothetical protein